jgi:hypothetical protein
MVRFCSRSTFLFLEAGSILNIETFRQMVMKKPDGFLGRYGLGDKLLKEGKNLEEAAEHLHMAVKLDPVHVASHLALGRTLAGPSVAWRRKPGKAYRSPISGSLHVCPHQNNSGLIPMKCPTAKPLSGFLISYSTCTSPSSDKKGYTEEAAYSILL